MTPQWLMAVAGLVFMGPAMANHPPASRNQGCVYGIPEIAWAHAANRDPHYAVHICQDGTKIRAWQLRDAVLQANGYFRLNDARELVIVTESYSNDWDGAITSAAQGQRWVTEIQNPSHYRWPWGFFMATNGTGCVLRPPGAQYVGWTGHECQGMALEHSEKWLQWAPLIGMTQEQTDRREQARAIARFPAMQEWLIQNIRTRAYDGGIYPSPPGTGGQEIDVGTVCNIIDIPCNLRRLFIPDSTRVRERITQTLIYGSNTFPISIIAGAYSLERNPYTSEGAYWLFGSVLQVQWNLPETIRPIIIMIFTVLGALSALVIWRMYL